MLYWKYSQNRTFFINEWWLLIPTTLLIDYVIIRKMRSRKRKIEALKKLKAQIEHEKKLRRILFFSLGLTECTYFLPRGGADFINTDYIECGIDLGLRYLDDDRLRKIIHDLYRHKRKGKMIYITATAVCHLVNRYGRTFLALPFAVGDFGLTSLYQTSRKFLVCFLLGWIPPLWVAGRLSWAVILLSAGVRLAYTDLDSIPTSPVYITGPVVKPRMPGSADVVVVNNRDKVIMSSPVPENKECWLPDQTLFNSNCKSTEISNAIDLVSPNLKYNDVVNMQDVTGLDRVDFSDVLDLGQAEPSDSKLNRGKEVNFLDKFGDSGPINEEDMWDVSESPIPNKKYLRTRNKL